MSLATVDLNVSNPAVALKLEVKAALHFFSNLSSWGFVRLGHSLLGFCHSERPKIKNIETKHLVLCPVQWKNKHRQEVRHGHVPKRRKIATSCFALIQKSLTTTVIVSLPLRSLQCLWANLHSVHYCFSDTGLASPSNVWYYVVYSL